MSSPPSPAALGARFVEEIAKLVPVFAADPIDHQHSAGGNVAVVVIDADGAIHGRIFGSDRAKSRWVFGIANRKAMQVWSTGYATGRFEQLVYAGKLDDRPFGINRPDFIGWLGGVPFLTADGKLVAAAFSGFRGETDVAIVQRAAQALGLQAKPE